MAIVNGPLPVQPPVLPPVAPPPAPVAAPAEAAAPAQAAAADEAAESASSKGLLDYPKDLAMGVSKFAAEGTAKNSVEFLEDMQDIKEAAGDFGENIKHGEVLKAGGDVLRMGWNVLSGLGNAIQAGACSMVGGISMMPTIALNLLDKGSESVGKNLSTSDSAVVRGIGQGFKFLGGENSNKGYLDTIQEASREAEIKARNHQD